MSSWHRRILSPAFIHDAVTNQRADAHHTAYHCLPTIAVTCTASSCTRLAYGQLMYTPALTASLAFTDMHAVVLSRTELCAQGSPRCRKMDHGEEQDMQHGLVL